jgi:hypothetical protein
MHRGSVEMPERWDAWMQMSYLGTLLLLASALRGSGPESSRTMP